MDGIKRTDFSGRPLTRYCVDLYDDNEKYADVKSILDDTDNPSALIKDALIYFVRSERFNRVNYESKKHRKDIK